MAQAPARARRNRRRPIHNTRLVAIEVQQQPAFELRLRSGHLLRFPDGIATEAVAALLRAPEAP